MPRKLIVLLWLWFAAGIGAAVALAVLEPEGPLKWALRVIAIVPVCLMANAAMEGAASLFMSLPGLRQGTRYFENRYEGKTFSAPRAAWYGFCAVLGFILFIAVGTILWEGYSSARNFFAQDKCLDAGGKWAAAQQKCEHPSSVAR